MSEEQQQGSAASIRAVLDEVDRGELEASEVERAFLAGAASAWDLVVREGVPTAD